MKRLIASAISITVIAGSALVGIVPAQAVQTPSTLLNSTGSDVAVNINITYPGGNVRGEHLSIGEKITVGNNSYIVISGSTLKSWKIKVDSGSYSSCQTSNTIQFVTDYSRDYVVRAFNTANC